MSISPKRPMGFFILFVILTSFSYAGEDYPQRIVSLAPSLTEQLYLLGMGDNIVGVTTQCDQPLDAQKKEKIGTLMEPDIEKIVSLKPDLIIASKEDNKPQVIRKLRNLGINVYVSGESKNFFDICQNFIAIGGIVGEEKRAEEIVKEARKKIGLIREKTKDLPKIKVFWEYGAKPLITAAKDTFAHEFIELAGGINIVHNSKVRYPCYSREEVITQNPDIIILVAMGNVTEEEIKTWQRFKDLKAVREGKIYVVDAPTFCSPTPLTFAKGVRELANYLHPEAF